MAVENHFYCGSCYQCRHDRGDICQQMGQYGTGRKTTHGACAQYSIVSSKYCYKLTTDICELLFVVCDECVLNMSNQINVIYVIRLQDVWVIQFWRRPSFSPLQSWYWTPRHTKALYDMTDFAYRIHRWIPITQDHVMQGICDFFVVR